MLGPEHLDTLRSMQSLAIWYLESVERYKDAEELTLETHCSSSSEGGDCTAEAPIVGQPDSAVTIGVKNITAGDPSYSPSTAASPGDLLEFQVVYSNTGGASATNVSGTAPIPQFLGSPTVNLNCSTGSCGVNFVSGLPASVSWNTGTVAPNTSTTVTFNYVAGFCPAYTELPTVTTAEEGTVPVTPAAGAVTTTDPNGCIG